MNLGVSLNLPCVARAIDLQAPPAYNQIYGAKIR